MRFALLLVALLAPLALMGCESKQDTGTVVGAVAGGVLGNQFGRGGGRVASTMVGAVIGGIVGNEIGRSLDQRDRALAQQAEMDAWERGQSGRPVRWRNPDNGRYGEVIPEAPYRRGSVDCRDYVHKVYIDGRPQAMRGTACRNPDGTWTQVS
ncbi:MAG: glycine zipper 2TM domain-containing protein [Hyphomicrobiaceae bacterium]|nr:MAG: glycine zipper 2TM domain-containing protein [Hyphomicrobiaceae bacterium]